MGVGASVSTLQPIADKPQCLVHVLFTTEPVRAKKGSTSKEAARNGGDTADAISEDAAAASAAMKELGKALRTARAHF